MVLKQKKQVVIIKSNNKETSKNNQKISYMINEDKINDKNEKRKEQK